MADDDLATEATLGGDAVRAMDTGRGTVDIDELPLLAERVRAIVASLDNDART